MDHRAFSCVYVDLQRTKCIKLGDQLISELKTLNTKQDQPWRLTHSYSGSCRHKSRKIIARSLESATSPLDRKTVPCQVRKAFDSKMLLRH